MPNRSDQLCVPEGRWERARFLDEYFDTLLRGIPLQSGQWAAIHQLEAQLFPKGVTGFLGGPLDPTCPACGIETDEGTVERQKSGLFRVIYQTCGCVYDLTEEQLRQRVKHAGPA